MSMSAFSINLRRLRESRGLTQNTMAQTLGLSTVGFGAYERGDREPNLINLRRIAEVLNVSVDELLRGVLEEQKIEWALQGTAWVLAGFNVTEVDGGYVRIEPPAEATDCSPLELPRADFLRLTRAMNDESQKWHPDDRKMSALQFEVWARTVTNKRAALRRENPFNMVGKFLPLEYLPKLTKKASE